MRACLCASLRHMCATTAFFFSSFTPSFIQQICQSLSAARTLVSKDSWKSDPSQEDATCSRPQAPLGERHVDGARPRRPGVPSHDGERLAGAGRVASSPLAGALSSWDRRC